MSVETPEIVVRHAAEEEREQAGKMAVSAFSRLKDLLTPESWQEMERGIYATTITGPLGKLLVATRSGEIVGSVRHSGPGHGGHVIYPDTFAYMRALAVSHTCLRSGVGAKLSAACIDAARSEGAKALGLHVASANHPARALYEKLGLEYHAEAPDYFGIPYSIYLYEF